MAKYSSIKRQLGVTTTAKGRYLVQYLYTFLFILALPFIFARLMWRSLREPAYRSRLPERLGFYHFHFKKSLWVHAVSVGEVIAAIPLIQALQRQYPDLPMLVTTMTPTGAMRVKAALGDTVQHAYLPYDLPFCMQRFLRNTNPHIAIMMETELWPNLFMRLQQRQVPICILNARLSARSARGYGYVASVMRKMLSRVTLIAANGEADAKRFITLGANPANVHVTGNIKFDLQLPSSLLMESEQLKKTLGANRFIWIAASTHEGEEEIILAAHKKLREKMPNALLILVPRHASRFATVAKQIAADFVLARRSDMKTVQPDTQVFLGDSMGELLLFYSVAELAFVGGSLIPRGGHNFIEPAALGVPVMIGTHVFNFNQMFALFAKEKAIVSVGDTFAETLIQLAENKDARETLSKNALKVVAANRGALAKQLALIEKIFQP